MLKSDGVVCKCDVVVFKHNRLVLNCDGVVFKCDRLVFKRVGVVFKCDRVVFKCDRVVLKYVYTYPATCKKFPLCVFPTSLPVIRLNTTCNCSNKTRINFG